MLVLWIMQAGSQSLSAQDTDTLKDYRENVEHVMASATMKKAMGHVDAHKATILKEWIRLTEINAPSKHEKRRAKAIEALMRQTKLTNIHYDKAGNLIGIRKGTGGAPSLLLDAHMDTVFHLGLKIKATVKEGKIYAPGVGDDTRNIEAMLALLRAMDFARIRTKGDVIFLFTVEEETSLGGAKKFLEAKQIPVGSYIALDGGYNGFAYSGIGINNYRIHFIGPGGHTRSRTPPYSATLPLARAIERIYALTVPPESNLNIGMLNGSEVVNAKAADAWFSVDLRSTDNRVIADLEAKIEVIAKEEAAKEGMTARIEVMSTLAASQYPENRESRLAKTAEAVYLAMGFENPPITPNASNNSNVALLAGLPAISTGAAPCQDSHALTEWCEIEPLYKGIKKIMLLAVAMAGME